MLECLKVSTKVDLGTGSNADLLIADLSDKVCDTNLSHPAAEEKFIENNPLSRPERIA